MARSQQIAEGRLVGPKLPLTLKEVRAIRRSLNSAQQMRDLVMFTLAIDSALRACDLSACAMVRDPLGLSSRSNSDAVSSAAVAVIDLGAGMMPT